MELKIKLKKEDWEKILADANQLIKESAINLAVFQNTAELAREHLKKFPDDKKQKKLPDSTGKSEEVQSEVIKKNITS